MTTDSPTKDTPLPVVTATLDSSDSEGESTFKRMGIRAALVLILITTVCVISVMQAVQSIRLNELPEVTEPLKSLALLAIGYYFGQKNKG